MVIQALGLAVVGTFILRGLVWFCAELGCMICRRKLDSPRQLTTKLPVARALP